MLKGKVKWFDTKKGYGFIQSDDGKDYFVHYTSIMGDGFRNLEEGQSVTFEITEDTKGPKAVNVTVSK